MKNMLWLLIMKMTIVMGFSTCKGKFKAGSKLSKEEISDIKNNGLISDGEEVKLFYSQGKFVGAKASGNFFTNKRLASYWIDKRDSTKSNIDYAYYKDIDTIVPTDLSKSLTYSSYLEVRKSNGHKFKVFIDADSVTTWTFFNSAITEWKNNKVGI